MNTLYSSLLARSVKPFNLNEVGNAITPKPVVATDISKLNAHNVLNMLIKEKDSSLLTLPTGLDATYANLIRKIGYQCASTVSEDIFRHRYMYLTTHTAKLSEGQHQRMTGWHIDGLQGDEVSVKQNACINFIGSSSQYGTEVLMDSSNLFGGLNLSIDNIFRVMDDLYSDAKDIMYLKSDTMHMMDAYTIHRTPKVREECTRTILKLVLTHVPITSVTSTFNNNIEYDYDYHTTSGQVPAHLI